MARHWTEITTFEGDFFIDCKCGWSGYADSYEDAIEAATDHRESF